MIKIPVDRYIEIITKADTFSWFRNELYKEVKSAKACYGDEENSLGQEMFYEGYLTACENIQDILNDLYNHIKGRDIEWG